MPQAEVGLFRVEGQRGLDAEAGLLPAAVLPGEVGVLHEGRQASAREQAIAVHLQPGAYAHGGAEGEVVAQVDPAEPEALLVVELRVVVVREPVEVAEGEADDLAGGEGRDLRRLGLGEDLAGLVVLEVVEVHRVLAVEDHGLPVGTEAEPGDEVAQVGHRDRVVSTEIDGAEQGDAGRHTQAPPTLWSRAARAMNHPV